MDDYKTDFALTPVHQRYLELVDQLPYGQDCGMVRGQMADLVELMRLDVLPPMQARRVRR